MNTRQRCDWPRGMFRMQDDPDPHGHTYLVLPCGQMVDISHHSDPAVNPAQVAWMVEVLNRALAAEDQSHYWPAKCPKCGWKGLSRDCAGGQPIADTGDHSDLICPVCFDSGNGIVVRVEELA